MQLICQSQALRSFRMHEFNIHIYIYIYPFWLLIQRGEKEESHVHADRQSESTWKRICKNNPISSVEYPIRGGVLVISLLTLSRYYIFVAFPSRCTGFPLFLDFPPREVSGWSMRSSKKDQDWREYVSPVDFTKGRNFFVICIYFPPSGAKFPCVWYLLIRRFGFSAFRTLDYTSRLFETIRLTS